MAHSSPPAAPQFAAQPPTARAIGAKRRPRSKWLLRRALVALFALALVTSAWMAAIETKRRVSELERIVPPVVEPRPVLGLFIDATPVLLTMTVDSERVPFITTRDAVGSDPTLWRRLQIADWNTVAEPIRSVGLEAMLVHYDRLLLDPGAWDRMAASDWDEVPPAIRALAFRHMAEYWAGFYQVGADFDLPRELVADTLEAIVMSESWFDHRAVNVAGRDNRDLGLAQASDAARARLRALHDAAVVDAAFTDEEYFNPWNATRFLAIWFDLLLDEVAGDVDLAIRAYHRGVDRALDEQGAAYLDGVLRRRRRFIRNRNAPPAWSYLWRRDRDLQRQAWPWLFPPSRHPVE